MDLLKKSKFKTSSTLSLEDISKLSETIREFMLKRRVPKDVRIKTILLLETILDNWHNSLPEESIVNISFDKIFNNRHVVLEIEGPKSNPCFQEQDSDALENYTTHILDKLDVVPSYKYKNNINVVDIPIPNTRLPVAAQSLIAVFCALMTFGISFLLPSNIKHFLTEEIFEPLFEVCISTLEIFGLMLIFCSIISSVANITSKSLFNRYKTVVSSHLFKKNLFAAILVFATLPFFTGIINIDGHFDSSFLLNIYHMFLDAVPENIIDPFRNKNALQLMVLAIFSGFILFKLGNKAKSITGFFNEATIFATDSISALCQLNPLIIYLCLSNLLISGNIRELLKFWVLIALVILYSLAYFATTILLLKSKCRISVIQHLKDIFPFFLRGFLTRNMVTSITKNEHLACKKYNVNHNFARFAFPMMEVFYKLRFILCVSVNIIMIIHFYDSKISVGAFICLFMASFITCLIAPPVEGGILIIYQTLMIQTGIPEGALGLLVIIDIIQGMITTGLATMLLSSEALIMNKELEKSL